MATAIQPQNPVDDGQKTREEWINRIGDLVGTAEKWARELGWATRRIEKKMDDAQIGSYMAPGLLLQEETVRILLEPIGRSAPGGDGVVDLYLMPAYDDIATLLLSNGQWHLHYWFKGDRPNGDTLEAPAVPFSKEALEKVLAEMKRNAQ